jgi:membrane dipeptidase
MIQKNALHHAAMVIDGHNDTIVAHIRRGNYSLHAGPSGAATRHAGTVAFLRGAEAPRPGAEEIQINLPKMQAGGIDAAFFAIDVTHARKNHLAYALDGLGYLLQDLAASPIPARIVRHAHEIRTCHNHNELGILLAIEHADVTERSLNVLRMLYELGIRAIGLTHNVSSAAADGCLEARQGVGLTTFGIALIQEMNRLGMVVDLAHVSPAAFFSALDITSKPVIFSHGNAHALCHHPRNLTDAQLQALTANGGVIGVSYVPSFIDPKRPTLDRLLDHIDHIVTVAGIDTVGLGSDFDGGGTLLPDATVTPRITDGLITRGYNDTEIRQILGENFFRVLQATIR